MDVDLRADPVVGRPRTLVDAAADSWTKFWFADIPPGIFAVLRIVIGAVGCAALIGLANIPLFWSCHGMVASHQGEVCEALTRIGVERFAPASILLFAAVSFIAMTVGYRTRVATVCAIASMFAIADWNAMPLSAAHQVLRALLFCLLWAPCGERWSVDALARGADAGPLRPGTPVWPLRLFQIQVASIYLVTALWKLNNRLWLDGSALHYVYQNAQFRRSALLAAPGLDGWMTPLSYATLAWELGFAFLILHRRTRPWALWLGIGAHLGVWATLEVGPFSAVMLASYAAFLDPERIDRRVQQLTSLFVRRQPEVASANR